MEKIRETFKVSFSIRLQQSSSHTGTYLIDVVYFVNSSTAYDAFNHGCFLLKNEYQDKIAYIDSIHVTALNQ